MLPFLCLLSILLSLILFKIDLFICMYMSVLSVCLNMYHMCAWYLQRPEEGISSPNLEFQTVGSCQVGPVKRAGALGC